MNRTTDANAVAAVMDAYEAGTRNRDVAMLKGAFHENALMSGYLGPNLLVGGPEPFYAHLEGNEVEDGYAARTVHIDVNGNAASARVVEDNLWGMSFVNDFHLVKGEGGWKIVSKLFHHDAPGG
ncbi:MAG: nuclear transport factor 2 family protein [Pseudomonadota bacterium]